MEAEAGRQSLVEVIDPAPRQIPAPEAVSRALALLKGAKRPLIILGKGAAYAQVDDDIRALVEKSGIPYLPMSMAKGLLRSEEHTSELQSLMRISYAVFCLKKNKQKQRINTIIVT